MKVSLDLAGVIKQNLAIRQVADQAFYNTSKFTLLDLKSRGSQQQLLADFEDHLNDFPTADLASAEILWKSADAPSARSAPSGVSKPTSARVRI